MLVKWTHKIANWAERTLACKAGMSGCKTLQMWMARMAVLISDVYNQGPDGAEQGQLLATHRGGKHGKRYDLGSEQSEGTLGCLGFRTILESLGPNSRQAMLMDRACRSPTRLTDASASSWAVFNKSALRLVDCNV